MDLGDSEYDPKGLQESAEEEMAIDDDSVIETSSEIEEVRNVLNLDEEDLEPFQPVTPLETMENNPLGDGQ